MIAQQHDWMEVNQFDSVCLMCGCKRRRYESYNIYALGTITGDSPIPCRYISAEGKREWLFWYRIFRNEHTKAQRYWMKKERYKAALERKLEAAQRRIDQLQDRVWQLEAQEHNRDDGNEWEKEYYLRGMHR